MIYFAHTGEYDGVGEKALESSQNTDTSVVVIGALAAVAVAFLVTYLVTKQASSEKSSKK